VQPDAVTVDAVAPAPVSAATISAVVPVSAEQPPPVTVDTSPASVSVAVDLPPPPPAPDIPWLDEYRDAVDLPPPPPAPDIPWLDEYRDAVGDVPPLEPTVAKPELIPPDAVTGIVNVPTVKAVIDEPDLPTMPHIPDQIVTVRGVIADVPTVTVDTQRPPKDIAAPKPVTVPVEITPDMPAAAVFAAILERGRLAIAAAADEEERMPGAIARAVEAFKAQIGLARQLVVLAKERQTLQESMAADAKKAVAAAGIDAAIAEARAEIAALMFEPVPTKRGKLAAFRDARDAAAAQAKDDEAFADKIAELEERERRGLHITKRGQAMLEDWHALQARDAAVKAQQANIAALEQQRMDLMRGQLGHLVSIDGKLTFLSAALRAT